MLQFRRLCCGAPLSQASWPPRKPDMRALLNRPRHRRPLSFWFSVPSTQRGWLAVAAFSLPLLFGGSVGGNLALALEGGTYSNPAEPNELEPAVQAPPRTDTYYGK